MAAAKLNLQVNEVLTELLTAGFLFVGILPHRLCHDIYDELMAHRIWLRCLI